MVHCFYGDSCDNDTDGTVYIDVSLPRLAIWGTSHLGHVFLGLSWVELFVLLCDKKVTWVCRIRKRIFYSRSKNRSDMALGVYHFMFFSLSWSINIID